MSTNPSGPVLNTLRNTLKRDFAQVPNALINDFSIHPMARFLFTYMAAQHEDFVFPHSTLQKAIGAKSEKTLLKYLKSLLSKGWLSREERRTQGRFSGYDYTLHAYPTVRQNLPDGKKTGPEKNRAGKNDPLNNTIYSSPSEKKETTRSERARPDSEISPAGSTAQPDAPSPGSAAPPSTEEAPHDPHFPYSTGDLNDFLKGGEEAFRNIRSRVAAYHQDHPGVGRRICQSAKCDMTAAQYREELDEWINYHLGNQRFYTCPTRTLQRGKGSLWEWLMRDWRQEKYNPVYRAQAQQQAARAAAPTYVPGRQVDINAIV